MGVPWPSSDRTTQAVIQLAVCFSFFPALLLSGATLQEQVDRAVSAFTSAQFNESYWAFEGIELDYGQEPEFLDSDFQKTILPVRAYSAIMAERPTDALVLFEEFLSGYETSPGLKAFALYNTAIALTQIGANAQAAEAFREFRLTFSGSAEAHLALLQEADLLAEIGEASTANQLLDDFYVSEAPENLRTQGRLRALQLASERKDSDRINELLFETQWTLDSMPNIAVLCFAALEAGDLLLAENLHKEAINAYRLSLPREVLIEKQRERLAATKYAFSEQSEFASSIWRNYTAQLITRLESQLLRLESMPDYTPGLYLRSGQAYLLSDRFREASILFRTIALSENYEKDIRAEAHYRWILAQNAAEEWQASRDIADSFIQSHPKHPLASSALFLVARSYQGEGLFQDAILVLSDLIETFPKDKLAPRWYFTRGYNYSVLEQQAAARKSFEEALERFPKSELATQLEMWAALTHFFERDYDTALTRLQKLEKKSTSHPLYPEIKYRIANALYAMRDYDASMKVIEQLVEKFSDHHRYAEALALRGDIYMGLGEQAAAAHAFKQVPDDDSQLFDYATFQAAKIYRALERYDLLREHLQKYLKREDANERPRVSEALYWIGWSLEQEGRGKESFQLFEDALARFGNDTKARAVESILSAYSALRDKEDTNTSFQVWLQNALEESLDQGQLTWFARLTQFKANSRRSEIGDIRADTSLLSIHRLVPIQEQDAATLATVGVILAERENDAADEYFERILEEFPKRSERAAAFYGKALLASQNDRLDESRRWLLRFLEETPTHPLAADTRLLAAEVLRRQGLYEAAATSLNEILQLKAMRGRPHARALAGLARIETDRQNPKRAIPYWQRIYTLYRAYPELLAEAYWKSALLFKEIDDPIAAHNTLLEMLRDDRLSQFEEFKLAEAKIPTLETAAQARRLLETQQLLKEGEVKQ